MTARQDIARFIANYRSEIDGAALYRSMAASESKSEVAELYRRLATVEETHAEFWRRRIENAGVKPPKADLAGEPNCSSGPPAASERRPYSL
jgi:rubrerythrin